LLRHQLPRADRRGMPIANPMATWEKAPLSTMRNTFPRSARSAMRTPISPVRCSALLGQIRRHDTPIHHG